MPDAQASRKRSRRRSGYTYAGPFHPTAMLARPEAQSVDEHAATVRTIESVLKPGTVALLVDRFGRETHVRAPKRRRRRGGRRVPA